MFLEAVGRFLGVIVVGRADGEVPGYPRDLPDDFLVHILDVFRVETVFLVLAHESDELFSHFLFII